MFSNRKVTEPLLKPIGVLIMYAVKVRGGDLRRAKVTLLDDNAGTVAFETSPIVDVVRIPLLRVRWWRFQLKWLVKLNVVTVKLIEVYPDPHDRDVMWYKGEIDDQLIQVGYRAEPKL